VLTGTQVLLLVVSETGLVYTFTTPKLQPLVTKAEGKNLIQVSPLMHVSGVALICAQTLTRTFSAIPQACLNAPEPSTGNENGVDDANQVDSPEESPAAHIPAQSGRQAIQQNPHMASSYMPTVPIDASQMAYQNYVQAQQQRAAPYAMPPQPGMPPHTSHQS
jgi:pheromone receptor transcription factor